jgi:thiol-disulfide isomerase/thioredoxin
MDKIDLSIEGAPESEETPRQGAFGRLYRSLYEWWNGEPSEEVSVEEPAQPEPAPAKGRKAPRKPSLLTSGIIITLSMAVGGGGGVIWHYVEKEQERASRRICLNDLRKGARPAPYFEGETLDGKPVRLGDYRGKVVLMDFWSTGCGPCIGEMPVVAGMERDYGDKGLVVMGMCMDSEENREKAKDIVREKGLKGPQLFFNRYRGKEMRKLYGVECFPAIYLIDRDGTIRFDYVTIGELRGKIDTLLRE